MKAIVLILLLVISRVAGLLAVASGSARDDVIAACGAPKSSTQMDAKEILVYPGGRVVLEKDW